MCDVCACVSRLEYVCCSFCSQKSEECRQLTAELDEERVNYEAAKGDRDKAQSSLSQAEEKVHNNRHMILLTHCIN